MPLNIPVGQAVEFVPMSHLTRIEQRVVDNTPSQWGSDPSIVFDRKVSQLASYLNCTESEATRIFLRNL